MALGESVVMTSSEAINLALREEMERDASVVLLGEDVSLGGYLAVTKGLVDRFGPERVRDTPISENAIVGGAVGAAMNGLRPVAEILFADFLTVCADPLINQAAKLRYMSGGQYSVPLVVRTPGGTGLGMAAQHSQSLESLFMNIPGLIVAAPGTPRDCRAVLKAAIRSNNPVLFFEHKLLYLVEGPVPVGDDVAPLGSARVVREGRDVTVVALSYMVQVALEAAAELEKDGIDVEVIDPRTIAPFDIETVLRSVEKTRRLVTVEENPVRGGFGAEVVARVAAAAHGMLASAPVRVGLRNSQRSRRPAGGAGHDPRVGRAGGSVTRLEIYGRRAASNCPGHRRRPPLDAARLRRHAAARIHDASRGDRQRPPVRSENAGGSGIRQNCGVAPGSYRRHQSRQGLSARSKIG
jgi:pyruvate/2-oxoglutarate/acetoin dehydrogenase E1 component